MGSMDTTIRNFSPAAANVQDSRMFFVLHERSTGITRRDTRTAIRGFDVNSV
jgi:hypothetical protein